MRILYDFSVRRFATSKVFYSTEGTRNRAENIKTAQILVCSVENSPESHSEPAKGG
jgi:hypothetical protein